MSRLYKTLPNLANLYGIRRGPVLRLRYGTDIENDRGVGK